MQRAASEGLTRRRRRAYTAIDMIRVLMFDLGQTLVDAQHRPFAHVHTALGALEDFVATDGRPLHRCLVSDYTMLPPPVTPAQLRPVFDEYLALLDGTGLRPYFEPVARRVTLSTHAGVLKPAAAVFLKALARLRVKAGLAECLLITENAEHVAAVRQTLGMQALQFRAPGAAEFDFDDWSQAPALVAQHIGPGVPGNLQAAIRACLAARDVEVDDCPADDGAGPWPVRGRRWHAVELPPLGTVHVAVPVQGELRRAPNGELAATLPAPDAAAVAEAGDFARSLAAHGQIATGSGAPGRTTHALETDSEGRRRLVRRRFSAA
jgi:hypothetical protein